MFKKEETLLNAVQHGSYPNTNDSFPQNKTDVIA